MNTRTPTAYETELALEVVKPEVEELAEERAERDFWSGNTDDGALERAWKKEDRPS